MLYQISLQEFQGPVAKLLELIESRHLDITQISLAEVTADFLKYIETIEKDRSEILAEFLPVAAKLILIKSKAILPNLEFTEEESREIKKLEQQVSEYRRFKEASKIINELWRRNNVSLGREFLTGIRFIRHQKCSVDDNFKNFIPSENFFYPPSCFDLNLCAEMLRKIYREIAAQTIPDAELILKIINLEEKIQETLKRLSQETNNYFSSIIEKESLSDVVITFLAILHLFKDGKVMLAQDSHFEEIKIMTV